jgi:chemotaxis protein MotB
MRVDLIEASGSNFFESGSASMPKETEHILGMIAKEIGTLDNAVIIEGHTDSRPYASKDGYSNWELSADRANAARRVMERLGLQPAQVQSVRGHADRQPRNNGDPADPRNRRVSILVRSKAS